MNDCLEALKRIRKLKPQGIDHIWEAYDFDTDFELIEKELKALEIIKSKRLNLECLKTSKDYEEYSLLYYYFGDITKQDFDLLKEVLL